MKANPLISVVVPVYNTAPWLRKCLDSICGQTYRHLEILCVNDGSTDNSADILAEYAAKDERVKVINQTNAGLSAARNTALEQATGEYVTGVDSDDYLMLHTYATLLPWMQSGVDMICYGIKGVDVQGNIRANDYMELPCSGCVEPSSEIIGKTNAFFVNKLYRTELVRAWGISFPVGLRHEDAAFVYSYMPQVRSVYYEKEAMYCYLQREGSITNSERFRLRVFDFCPVLEYLFLYYKEHALLPRWKDLYQMIFMSFYENPVSGLSGSLQRKAKSLYRRMVLKTGMHREFPGVYPFNELVRYNALRSLFFWRNKTTRLYKILRWIILRVEELPDGSRKYQWLP